MFQFKNRRKPLLFSRSMPNFNQLQYTLLVILFLFRLVCVNVIVFIFDVVDVAHTTAAVVVFVVVVVSVIYFVLVKLT